MIMVKNFANFLTEVEQQVSGRLSTVSLIYDLERKRYANRLKLAEIENDVLNRVNPNEPEIIRSTDPNNFEAKQDRKFKTIIGVFEENLNKISVSVAELTDADPQLIYERVEGYVQGLEHTRLPATTVGDNFIGSCIATFVDFLMNPILAVENNPGLLTEEFFASKYRTLVSSRPSARPREVVYNAIASQLLEEQLGEFITVF